METKLTTPTEEKRRQTLEALRKMAARYRETNELLDKILPEPQPRIPGKLDPRQGE